MAWRTNWLRLEKMQTKCYNCEASFKKLQILQLAGLSDLAEISISNHNKYSNILNMHEIQYCDFNKMYFGDLLAEIHFLKKNNNPPPRTFLSVLCEVGG